MATGGSAQVRGFGTGVGSKTDIGAPPLTQLSIMSTRPGASIPKIPADRAPHSAINALNVGL